MWKIAAFADEISPELDEQIRVCKLNSVTHFELRGVYGKNVLDFDQSLRHEIKTKLAANNMGVACIGSPVGKDEFDPARPVPNMAKRAGQPQEAAKAVLFLVSEDSSFVYGANLFVDGGVSAMDLS